jgi:hypothetical protein
MNPDERESNLKLFTRRITLFRSRILVAVLLSGIVLFSFISLFSFPFLTSQARMRGGLCGTVADHYGCYAGYIDNGTDVTKISSTWIISPVTCQPKLNGSQDVNYWLAIGTNSTFVSNSLIDLIVTCFTGAKSPTYQLVMGVGTSKHVESLKVSSGNKLEPSINYNPSTGAVSEIVKDATTGKQVKATGNWNVGMAPAGAWLIVFQGLGWLAQFSTIKFTGCLINANVPISSTNNFETNIVRFDGKLMADATPLSSNGQSFSVNFVFNGA